MKTLATCVMILVAAAMASCTTVKGQPPLVVQCKAPMKGDRSATPALVGQEYGTQTTPIPLNSVQFSNWDLAKSVAVQQLNASRTATGTVQVTARFISCADQTMAIQVRTAFTKADLGPAEPTSAWQTVYLPPRATSIYSEKSISREVAQYLIEISSAN